MPNKAFNFAPIARVLMQLTQPRLLIGFFGQLDPIAQTQYPTLKSDQRIMPNTPAHPLLHQLTQLPRLGTEKVQQRWIQARGNPQPADETTHPMMLKTQQKPENHDPQTRQSPRVLKTAPRRASEYPQYQSPSGLSSTTRKSFRYSPTPPSTSGSSAPCRISARRSQSPF